MDEYIEREALMVALCEEITGDGDYYNGKDDMQDEIRDMVSRFPAADVATVRHGRIVGSLEDGRYRRRFSCCGEDATMITQWAWPKYCPNCGAKMDG